MKVSHFRLQPKKKDGEWTKELIWINEFKIRIYFPKQPSINIIQLTDSHHSKTKDHREHILRVDFKTHDYRSERSDFNFKILVLNERS